MGCCQKESEKMEAQKADGCCGGGHHHGHDHSAMKQEKECCKGGAISGFIKKIFGSKKQGCCN